MFDATSMRQAFSGPGMDTRQWISYGIVTDDTPESRSVIFDATDEEGTPIGHPIVVVKLEPSGTIVSCRVGGSIAGQGESEWYPFVVGDEVLVAIPEGDERAGCVIISRLNQSIDTFPRTVAGADSSENNFGFRRVRAPYITECGDSFLIRGAATGWQLAFDRTGNLFLSSADAHHLLLNQSGISLGTGDDAMSVQMAENATTGVPTVTLVAGDATLALASDVTSFFSPGAVSFSTAGVNASGHAVTAEQVVVFMQSVLLSIGANIPAAMTGTQLAALTPAILNGAMLQLVPTAAIAPYQAALDLLIATPSDPTGTIPGFGKAGFIL